MIRQAHTYLVGALSGVVVIGIAIAAFVVLVSAQVFHDLPIPALSSSDQKAAAVSQGKALTASSDQGAVASTGGIGTVQPNRTVANPNAGANAGQAGANNSRPQGHRQANGATPTEEATGPAEVVETAPNTSAPPATETGSGSGGGSKSGGSQGSQPSPEPPPNNPPPSGGGNSGGGSGSGGSSGGGETGGGSNNGTTPPGSGGEPSTGSSGGGGESTPPPGGLVTTSKPSETITEAANGTVGNVDEALGGTLSETGVTKVTEEVVNGAAGPESVVGKTVDGVGEVVGGLVGGNGQ
jgi:hypothetical protein